MRHVPAGDAGGGSGGEGVKFLWKEGRMKSESGVNVGIYQFFLQ